MRLVVSSEGTGGLYVPYRAGPAEKGTAEQDLKQRRE